MVDGFGKSEGAWRRSMRRAVVLGALAALLAGCISAPPKASPLFQANRLSTSFAVTNGDGIVTQRSRVVVEPSTQAASDLLNVLDSSQWAQNCDKPEQIDAAQRDLDARNSETDCGLSLVDPQETAFPAAELPADTTGWQFSATVHCASHNTDWATGADTLVTQVGRVVILYMVAYSSTVPGQSDFQIISALGARAHSALRV